MNYLVTTNKGNLWYFSNFKKLKLLEHTEKSIYTGDNSLRFIKQFGDFYLLGASEEILLVNFKYKLEIVGRTRLPGLCDIKDIAIGQNFVAILSGLRDSVYVLNKDLSQLYTCLNVGKNGNLEFFRERQSQCQEINSNYLQIFYCPAMNNYHEFNRLSLYGPVLILYSDGNKKAFAFEFNNFTHSFVDYDSPVIKTYVDGFDKIRESLGDEEVTDLIEYKI